MLQRFGAKEPVLMNRLHLESGGGYRNVHMSKTAQVHTCAHVHTHTHRDTHTHTQRRMHVKLAKSELGSTKSSVSIPVWVLF